MMIENTKVFKNLTNKKFPYIIKVHKCNIYSFNAICLMKKNTLFASMFVAVGAAASLMSLGSANTVDNADVYLTISGGDLSIGVTGSLDL